MSVRWLSRRSHSYKAGSDDWICIENSPGLEISSVTLEEGHHHWFNSVHAFDGETLSMEQLLDGPGPFEIGFPEGQRLLVSMTVAEYQRPPFAREDDWMDAPCGFLELQDGAQRRLSFKVEARSKLDPDTVPSSSLEALRLMTSVNRTRLIPPVLQWNDDVHAPFELVEPYQENDTYVFKIDKNAKDVGWVKPGEEANLERLKEAFGEPILIQRTGYSPNASFKGFATSCLLPVVEREDGMGLVGELLLDPSFFEDQRVDFGANHVAYAMLKWNLPPEWLRFDIHWRFFHDEGWLDEIYPENDSGKPKSATVTREAYRRAQRWELFSRKDFREWYAFVRITPILFDFPRGDLSGEFTLEI